MNLFDDGTDQILCIFFAFLLVGARGGGVEERETAPGNLIIFIPIAVF